MRIWTLTALTLCSATAFASSAALASSNVELVQSVPLETTLTVPGIRLTQQVWVDMIQSAQKSIDLEEFYIDNKSGESLEPVINAIEGAAARGVKVRLIVDIKFYATYSADPKELSQIPGIEVKTIDFSSTDGIQHAKYFVVDRKQFYEGSANMDWLALSHIHEVGLRVTDEAMAEKLETIFEKDWADGESISASAFSLSSNSTPMSSNISDSLPGFELVASPASANPEGVNDSLSAITQLMGSAKKSLQIQVYQYSTKSYKGSQRWTDLDAAIRQAANRGVQVQLMVDAVAMKSAKTEIRALAAIKNVQVRVVTVPPWSGGPLQYARLIHSKYFIVDETSGWVGSENWSETYFTGSRNVGITLHDAGTASQLGKIYNQVWTSGYLSNP